FGDRVVLEFRPEGYSGQAPVGDGELNICLVSVPKRISSLRAWAEARFQIPPNHSWRTITPLTREPISPGQSRLFLVGDAARVVEPFTGEGIYYALASGELAAKAILLQRNGGSAEDDAAGHRGDCGSFFGNFRERNVADEAIAPLHGRIIHAVDTDIDDNRAVPHVLRADKFRLANRRDKDIGRARDLGQPLTTRMNDG